MGDVATFAAERALVAFLRADRACAERLIARHLPDERGHCSGCRLQRRFTAAPCRLLMLAAEAVGITVPQPRSPDDLPAPPARADTVTGLAPQSMASHRVAGPPPDVGRHG